MSPLEDDVEAHAQGREPESFRAFIGREWRALAVALGLFLVLDGALLAWLDPAFFYSRISYDARMYWLIAAGVPRLADNLPAFTYVSLPGLVRAPLFLVTRDPDVRLRLVQATNLLLLGALGVLFSYTASRWLPGRWAKAIIALSFVHLLLDGTWQANLFTPLGDLMFALLLLGGMRLAERLACEHGAQRRLLALAFAVVTAAAFLTKFTGATLVLYAWLCAVRSRGADRRTMAAVSVGGLVLLPFVVVEWHVIILYARLGLARAGITGAANWLLYFVTVAVPSSLVPNFSSALSTPPMLGMTTYHWVITTQDIAALGLGALLTAIVALGIWSERRRMLPELMMVVLPLPLTAPVSWSAIRYLSPYQPLLWVFAIAGIAAITAGRGWHVPALSRRAVGAIAAALFVVLVAARVGERMVNRGARLGDAPLYVSSVSSVYRDERAFLETLPPSRTRLVAPATELGRWTAITGLHYLAADSTLSRAAARYDLLLVLDCDDRYYYCRDFGAWEREARRALPENVVVLEPALFARDTPFAKARVFRLAPHRTDDAR